MPLINVPNINQDDAATPELWNSRYAAIVNLLNGLIDDVNLANNSITTPKLVNGSVTTDKLASSAVTPTKWANPYKFRVYASGAAAVSSGVWTKVVLNTEDFDTNNNFDSTTNHRYVIPVSGFYFIQGQVRLTTSGAATNVIMTAAIYKNNSHLMTAGNHGGSGNTAVIPAATMSGLFQFNAGDYIELFGYVGEAGRHIEGGTNNTFMSGFLVSPT